MARGQTAKSSPARTIQPLRTTATPEGVRISKSITYSVPCRPLPSSSAAQPFRAAARESQRARIRAALVLAELMLRIEIARLTPHVSRQSD
jgi:hypothetical protein